MTQRPLTWPTYMARGLHANLLDRAALRTPFNPEPPAFRPFNRFSPVDTVDVIHARHVGSIDRAASAAVAEIVALTSNEAPIYFRITDISDEGRQRLAQHDDTAMAALRDMLAFILEDDVNGFERMLTRAPFTIA
jgi:hypothetical protein